MIAQVAVNVIADKNSLCFLRIYEEEYIQLLILNKNQYHYCISYNG